MNIISWGNEKIKRLNVYDVGLIKVACIFIGMITGAFFVKTVKKAWPVFAAMAVLTSIPVLFKIFSNRQNTY